MDILETFANFSLWNNTGLDYFYALIIFIASLVILKLFQVIILSRLFKLAQKTKTQFDDTLIEVFKSIKPPFYFFISLYLGINSLVVSDMVIKFFKVLFIVVIVYEIIRAIEKLLEYFINLYFSKKEGEEEHTKSIMKTLQSIIRIFLWTIGFTLILSNLGVNITSIVASLGVGGIAIALALKNVLSDIFSSFSIYIDKPFEVGDTIAVGKDRGAVEKIGLKSTRIKTLQGEELTISNQELTSARVQNFKRMEDWRAIFDIGVVYGTKQMKLRSIPRIVKDIIKKEKLATFERCYFTTFGDFSLIYEVVFYVNSKEYDDFLRIKHKINLEIYREFEKEGIEFAYPTQTVIVDKKDD